ncbi:transcription factor IIIA-like [Oncorhynchus nerka]|uniref:transcription factor IIIA-like n=1 Tax=Oncorhynchus nerka TaxID=8023 RepID=UPI0011312318|nr:transcription factor IIIA-like [Oncorhynchus nerka]
MRKPFVYEHDSCDKSFCTKYHLAWHQRSHSGYPCEEDGCSFIGKTWTEYIKHRRELQRCMPSHAL